MAIFPDLPGSAHSSSKFSKEATALEITASEYD